MRLTGLKAPTNELVFKVTWDGIGLYSTSVGSPSTVACRQRQHQNRHLTDIRRACCLKATKWAHNFKRDYVGRIVLFALQVHCCFTPTETKRTIRDREPRTATSTFTQLLSFDWPQVQVQCCFTSTETKRTIRDREPRTATSTFTQLLSSESAFHAGQFFSVASLFRR